MGYYTRYTLGWVDTTKTGITEGQIVSSLSRINSDYFREEYSLELCLEEPIKWYEHDKDMVNLSKEYPEVIFLLEGEGEEPDDHWRELYYDGNCARAQAVISFPEYVWKNTNNRPNLTAKNVNNLFEKGRI